MIARSGICSGVVVSSSKRECRLSRASRACLAGIWGARCPAPRSSAWTARRRPSFFPHEFLNRAAVYMVQVIQCLELVVADLEKEVMKAAGLSPEFKLLKTLPGVGMILGHGPSCTRWVTFAVFPVLATIPPIVAVWRPIGSRREKAREKAIARTAIDIWPGPMRKPPILPIAPIRRCSDSTVARSHKQTPWWRTTPWGINWLGRLITS